MLSAPPGLEDFAAKKTGCAEEELHSLTKTEMRAKRPQKDEILGSSESTEATVLADVENPIDTSLEVEEEKGVKSPERSRSESSDQEPEKELDPNSAPCSPVHDTEHWLWMQEQMNNGYNGYCQDLYTGANQWGMSGYDPAAWSQMDTAQMAAHFNAAYGFTGDASCRGYGSDAWQVAAAALTAGISKIVDPVEWSNICTVVMQNLPSHITRDLLTAEIDNAGFSHAYDFIDLPIDPENNANRGSALINFTAPGFALMFKMHFEAQGLADFGSHRVVSVVPAALQGFDANFAAWSEKATESAKTRQEFAKPAPRKEGKRGGRHKASLIDIAARAQNLSQSDAAVDTIKPPPGLFSPPVESAPPGFFSPPVDSAPPGLFTKESSPCVAKETPKSPKQAQADESPKKFSLNFCPYCGGTLKEGFKFCRFCGSSLTFGSS